MIRVLIADDQAIIRAGLKLILESEDDIRVEGEADNGGTALDLLQTPPWHAALLDINMPALSGLEVLKHMRQRHLDIPVLIISMYPEEQHAMRAIKTGAAGYLHKNCDPAELVRAVRRVAGGGKYVSDEFAERLLSPSAEKSGHMLLSDREMQIFEMIVGGKALIEIANLLNISEKTVSTYRARIMDKMRLSSNADLVRYALEHHLLH